MMMMVIMNCFLRMIEAFNDGDDDDDDDDDDEDEQFLQNDLMTKGVKPISSWDHCRRFSSPQISTCFDQNLTMCMLH